MPDDRPLPASAPASASASAPDERLPNSGAYRLESEVGEHRDFSHVMR